MAETALVPSARDDLFPLAFCFEDARFGTCTGVHLPAANSVAADSLLASLHPKERELCRSMRGMRLVEFAGGRHASRLARERMKAARAPTLTAANGAPDVAGGVRISLSHTQKLAAALASSDARYAIGVDIEAIATDRRADHLLAERILSPAECVRARADLDIVQRLSIKEAAYKAISALTKTHLPLREIAVTREGGGFRLQLPDAAIEVEAISSRIEGHYLSLARARRAL